MIYSEHCHLGRDDRNRRATDAVNAISDDNRATKGDVPERLVEALRGTHGGLDVDRADVLPVLLEEGDEEVDGEGDVPHQLVIST